MRRVLALLVAAAVALTLVLAVETASADVHLVSQAGCAASANSGAIASRQAIEHGRPGVPGQIPIPVDASEGKTQSEGGQAPAQAENC